MDKIWSSSPLSMTELGIYLDWTKNLQGTAYNIPWLYPLPQGTDLDRLREALTETVRAHPGILSRFAQGEDGNVMRKTPTGARETLPVTISESKGEPDLNKLIRPFSNPEDELYRFQIIQGKEQAWLFCDIHHILFDGHSEDVFLSELNRAYHGLTPVGETLSTADYARQEHKMRETDAFEAAKKWYVDLLDGEETVSEPFHDHEGESWKCDWLERELDLSFEEVSAFVKAAGIRTGSFFTGVYGYLLSRFSGAGEALYSTIYHGRTPETMNTIGMFVKTFPVLERFACTDNIQEHLRQLNEQIRKSRENGLFSYADISSAFGLSIPTMFAYQGGLKGEKEFLDGSFLIENIESDDAKANIAVEMHAIGNSCKLRIFWRSALYERESMEIFARCYEQIAKEFMQKESFGDILLLTPETENELDRFNATQADYPVRDIVSMWRDAAERYADSNAVVFKDKVFTYRQVDEISERIAGHLRSCGIGKGDVVSILIPRCEWMTIAPLGVLKAGAAYQPLDPSYPPERLNFMMKDADCRLLIADETLLEIVSDYKGPALKTQDILTLPACEKLCDHPDPEDMFVLLYTSGSTGVPKGVILEHRNLCNLAYMACDSYGIDENTHSATYASFGFDATLLDTWPALTHGGCVYIIEEEIRLDLLAMEAWFKRHGITHSVMTTQVARQFYTSTKVPSLRCLTAGGEKLVPVEPVADGPTLYNGYGPSECTVTCCMQPVDRLYDRVPVGKAYPNVKLYVVDENMNRLPPLVPGELLIAGRGVGRGYLNRPDLTEKAFIKNPFSDEPDYARAYRTGDVVRLLPNGSYDFVGRNDGQVKVRGFRIELTEVEGVIREFPGIRDATVHAFEDEATGEKYIAAYVVSDSEVDIDALNDFIRERKPPYMVPAITMQLEKIPLTQNGKVNKRALPKPEKKAKSAGTAGSAAPLNLLEEELKQTLSELLHTADFGLTDRFGDLGLNSLAGIRLAVLLNKQYGIQPDVRTLSEQSLQSVENEILSVLLRKKDAPAPEADAHDDGKNEAPEQAPRRSARLSFSQQGVYAEVQAKPDSVQYNIPSVLRLPDGTTEEELENAVHKVVEAHPYLLCRFVPDEKNEIVQEPILDCRLEIPVSRMSPDEFEKHTREFVRPFDLEHGPAIRFEIVRADALYLLADMHHLVCDGASMDLFVSQLCQTLDGQTPEQERYSYYDFAAEESISPETERFFEQKMSSAEEATRLIPDVYDESLPHSEKLVSVPTDIAAVKEHARKLSVTPAAVYLAAAQLTFGRYVCEDTAAIATISGGRRNLKLSDTMGMFVNTLPIVTALDKTEKTEDFLRRVAKDFSDSIDHENYPFARIAAKYDFHPALSYAYQIGVLTEYRTKRGEVQVESLALDIAKIPISVSVDGTEEEARITVTYDGALYSVEMMTGLGESIENAVRGLLRCEVLGDISLTNEKQWAVLDSFNGPWDLDFDTEDTAVSVFKRSVSMQPEKTAAVFRDRSWTYRELDELTDRLAAKLYRKVSELTGKTRLAEETVAILIHRDENVFLLPLAAVKAGLAYEPLDPGYPPERLNFMVKDAGICLLLAEDDLCGLVNEYQGPVLTVQELHNMEEASPVPAGPKPEDLFILLYTSGSTGTPKGCQIEHRNLVAYAHGVRNDFYTREDRIAAYASFGFDVNMSDVFCTLLNGGTLVLIPEEIRMDLGALAATFDEAEVTALLLTTQVGVQFLLNYPRLKTLRMLVMGGEKLPAVDPSKLSYTIVNGYGPTENCCGVSLFPIREWEPNIPIGKPMNTIHGYVLDKTGHRLPTGAAGEYCLSGPQVSRGYLKRPDKTAEAYEASPFDDFRMYHTGDIVRYRPNGDVEFVGRRDGQVKIRGFRIETKEVEAVIRGYAGIRDVTVQAYDYEGGGKYLAAFVVSDTALDTAKLADYIRTQKPAYMVPAVIMQLEKIPLTVNQKVDKKALPEPKLQKAAFVEPKGKAEEDFCAVFAEVLGLARVSAEDDFFEVGGNSILAMKVVIAAEKAGYHIVYNDVFSHTTPRDMAAFLGQAGEGGTPTRVGADETAPADEHAASPLPETGPDGYDYRGIHALLAKNTMAAFRSGERLSLNDVLLLGGTGYLGSHVLHELIVRHDNRIFCFIRPGKGKSGEARLKETLHAYFGEEYAELFGSRITVVEGDAADGTALSAFTAPSKDMTVINCAASVKHFARPGELEHANIDSVRSLIDWCVQNGARLVHISTCSVAGERKNGLPPESWRLDEHGLYAGQELENNRYVWSKFMAERSVYEAILERGLRAKVCRMANLAPRAADGEFQLNYTTNNFMNTIRAFETLGMIPFDSLSEPTEFSPIDCAARAVLALASTPDDCVCFMLLNPHRPLMGDIMRVLEEMGHPVRGVENDELAAALQKALTDEKTMEAVSCLAAYNTGDSGSEIGLEGCDGSYTARVLGRLGAAYAETGSAYIRQFLSRLEQKGFFGEV